MKTDDLRARAYGIVLTAKHGLCVAEIVDFMLAFAAEVSASQPRCYVQCRMRDAARENKDE